MPYYIVIYYILLYIPKRKKYIKKEKGLKNSARQGVSHYSLS